MKLHPSHFSDDELVLFFYGESRRAAAVREHLDHCDACSALYTEIAGTLKLVTAPEAPERDDRYGLEVWQRIRPLLPVTPPAPLPFWRRQWQPIALLATAATIVIAVGVGREWLRPNTPAPGSIVKIAVPTAPDALSDTPDRVRLAAITDHLEQSERLLLDFANVGGREIDLTSHQAWADDLLQSNRFYREAASTAGDNGVADVLDDLERSLLDIANGPSKLTAADLERVRLRVDAAALLFKVRVLSDALEEQNAVRDTVPAKGRPTI